MLIYLFSLITRNPAFGVTTRFEIDQTAQLQRKTTVLKKLNTLYHLSSEQEMKALIRLCRCNRLTCAFAVRKGIKQVFLWPGSIYFLLPPGVGKRGTCSPPPPPPPSWHCRIMNDFFFLAFGGLVVGGGEGACEFATPPSLYPYSTQSIYICVGVVAVGTDRLFWVHSYPWLEMNN